MEGLFYPGMSKDDLQAASRFMTGSYTVDTLPQPNASNVQMYAYVTDLFGYLSDYVRCIKVGSNYYWRPVAQTYAVPPSSLANTDITLFPLKSPPVAIYNGTLMASRSILLSTDKAWPGAMYDIGFDGNLGLFGLNVKLAGTGVALGSLIAGGRKRFVFDGTSWQLF